MILSIHQPSYFLWVGQILKIGLSDEHVILDDVQLSDRAFQHRNLFMNSNKKAQFLTIPIEKTGYRNKKIKDLKVIDSDWASDHLNKLIEWYRKHKYFQETIEIIEPVFHHKSDFLIDYLFRSMEVILKNTNIKTKILMQSDLNMSSNLRNQDLILKIAKITGAKKYLSGQGAKEYQDATKFINANLELNYLNFYPNKYEQYKSEEFLPGLSVIDELMNLGIKNVRHRIYCKIKDVYLLNDLGNDVRN